MGDTLNKVTPEEWDNVTKPYGKRGKVVDAINPTHYTRSGIQPIDYLKSMLTKDEYHGYLRGSITKYLHRYTDKNGVEDLRKAQWFLGRLIIEVEDNGS